MKPHNIRSYISRHTTATVWGAATLICIILGIGAVGYMTFGTSETRGYVLTSGERVTLQAPSTTPLGDMRLYMKGSSQTQSLTHVKLIELTHSRTPIYETIPSSWNTSCAVLYVRGVKTRLTLEQSGIPGGSDDQMCDYDAPDSY